MLFNCVRFCNAAELSGKVFDDKGVAVKGARVDISIAAPIKGPSLFCPSCYLDCSKWTTTDTSGHFVISGLDESLKFRIVITASEKSVYRSEFVDPSREKIEVRLSTAPKVIENRVIRSRLVSEDGVPVSGALIQTTRPASMKDCICVSDDMGSFELSLSEDFSKVDIEVFAAGHPATRIAGLEAGRKVKDITLITGCRVTGTLKLKKSFSAKPVIAAVQVDRSVQFRTFAGAVLANVSEEGAFEFADLYPNEYYCIYSPILSGINQTQLINTSVFLTSDGDTIDLGILDAVNGNRIAGRLTMKNDAPLPEKLSISLFRKPAWDFGQVPVHADGSFTIGNVPFESYEFLVNTDLANIDFGKFNFQPTGRRSFATYPLAEVIEIPLVMPENLRDNTADRTVTGRVVDRSGKPLGGINIIPTRFSFNEKIAKPFVTNSDGEFIFHSIPNSPFELFFYHREAIDTVKTKKNTIRVPGQLFVGPHQSEVQLVYDRTLLNALPLITPQAKTNHAPSN